MQRFRFAFLLPMKADNTLELLASLAPPIPCEYPDGDAGMFLKDPASQPFALLVGAIALYGSELPWTLPYVLRTRLNIECFDARAIVAVDENVLRLVLSDASAYVLHMDPSRMAKWVRQSAQVIVGQYGGGTSWIWNDYRRIETAQLIRRLMELPGIGSVKALVLAFLLYRDWGADIVGWEKLQPPMSDTMRTAAFRLGIQSSISSSPEQIVMVCEGLRNIAKSFCVEDGPLCGNCPLLTGCPRQGV